MLRILFFTSIMSWMLSPVLAQDAFDKVQKIIQEKIRVSPEVLNQITSGQIPEWINEKQKEHSGATRAANMIVSGNSDPESEVHAAINPLDSSNIIVSANLSATSSLTDGLNPIYYTKNFGSTWELSDFQTKPDGNSLILGGGDPLFAFDKNGLVYMSWINLHADFTNVYWDLFWASSADGGENWTKGTEPIAQGVGDLFTFIPDMIYDKEWMVADRTNSSFQNTVYCVFFESNGDGTVFQIGVRKKSPSDNNFTNASVQASDNGFTNMQFSSIDIDPNGGVHVIYFATVDDVNWALYHALSTDGASTFGASEKISDVYLQNYSFTPTNDSIVGIQKSRMYPCPHVKVDKSGGSFNGRVYAVWSADGISSNLGTATDVYISHSTDNGTTWSAAQKVNNDNTSNDNFYPSIDISPDGAVAMAWYDRRWDPNNLNTYYFMAYSFDGGSTFPNQFKVSDEGTDFSTVGAMTGGFGIGEYNQVITTSTKAIPVWADARNNDGQLDIYAAIVDLKPSVTSAGSLSIVNANFNITNLLPNPVSEILYVEIQTSTKSFLKLSFEDVAGKIWQTQELNVIGSGKYQFDVKKLPAGTYTLSAIDGKSIICRKFVKL